MSDFPEISIVTPTRNRRALLLETIASVQVQNFPAWELLVVDDDSDDGTAEEVTRLAAADARIRFVPRAGATRGANARRNQGLALARTDLLVFLDSDDLLRPGCLENRTEIMRRNRDLDFAVFRGGVFEKSPGDLPRLFHTQTHADDLLRLLSAECPWQTTGPIWRKRFLEKIGGFDENLLSMQDLELHVRAICAGGRYVCFPDVDHDINWRYDSERISVRNDFDPDYIEAALKVHAALRRDVTEADLMTWSRARAITGLCFASAEALVRIGRLGVALEIWKRGCRLLPVPAHLRLMGLVMLCIRRMGAWDEGLAYRLVNKWKGWVRFRQEPDLMRKNG